MPYGRPGRLRRPLDGRANSGRRPRPAHGGRHPADPLRTCPVRAGLRLGRVRRTGVRSPGRPGRVRRARGCGSATSRPGPARWWSPPAGLRTAPSSSRGSTRCTSAGGDSFDSVEISKLAAACHDVHRRHRRRAARARRPGDGAVTLHDRTFPALNAVRAAGAIMVLLTHAAFNTGRINDGWVGAMLARFDFGVTLFFVLSGFLLSRPWFLAAALGHREPSARHYLWKRALRILPLYWVVVVVAFVVDPLNDDATWEDWVSHLTLTQLYRHDLLAELADPDVEPVHRGRVLPRAAADLPRHGRPPRQDAAAEPGAGRRRRAQSGRPGLAGDRGADPRPRGALRAVAARLPAVVHGRARLRSDLGRSGRAPPRSPARAAGPRPDRLLDPRDRHVRPGLLAAGRAAAAADPRRVAGGHQGRPVRRRGRVLRTAARLRSRARWAGRAAS